MAYNKTNWTETTSITPARLNDLETQYDEALADSNSYTDQKLSVVNPTIITIWSGEWDLSASHVFSEIIPCDFTFWADMAKGRKVYFECGMTRGGVSGGTFNAVLSRQEPSYEHVVTLSTTVSSPSDMMRRSGPLSLTDGGVYGITVNAADDFGVLYCARLVID